MNGRETILETLLENIDDMLEIIEDQENLEPGFALAHEVAIQLREELVALQE